MLPHLPFTLRQLQVFASLCSTRSFRRSAESLGISQASVSNQMNALEEQLGLSLFVRGRGQRPVLTAEGTAFLEDLRSFEKVAGALAAHRRPSTLDEAMPARYRLLVGHGTLDRYIRPKGLELPLTREQVNTLPFILPLTYPTEEQMLEFYERHGIKPRHITGRTQHYDVMVAMAERGIGVAYLTDALLPVEMREEVIMLHPVENWRLMWYRKDAGGDPRCDAVEAFLLSSVLQDPDYRTI